MIQHVYERAQKAREVKEVWIATEDIRIARAVEGFGGKAVMTSPKHPTGTHRVIEAQKMVGGDPVVNLQGDEPLIDPQQVDLVIKALEEDPSADLATLGVLSRDSQEIGDPNNVKVVMDHQQYAMYFSRAPIPFYRDEGSLGPGASKSAWIHVGIYAYRKEALEMIQSLPPAPWEEAEKLEQLRFLYWGLRIKVIPTHQRTIGVDVPEDAARVERILLQELSREGA